MKVLKLGQIVHDIITGMDGSLTHMMVYIGGNIEYVFQPRSLNSTTNLPSKKMWMPKERLQRGEEIEIDIPFHILGTEVEDEVTGFKGKIVHLVYHLDNCLHVDVKPSGLNSQGEPHDSAEFDIRRVKGPAITEAKQKQVEEAPDSPTEYPQKRYA